MSGLSKHLALSLFNMSLNPVRFAYEPPTGLWLALHTAAPSDSTYGSEATYDGYARQTINSLTANPLTETAGGNVDILVTNGAAIVFPESASEAGQTITHWAIWDTQTVGEGNVLYSGALGSPRLISLGDSVVVPELAMSLTIK